MVNKHGPNKVDLFWCGALSASLLVHVCLLSGGWLLIGHPERLPQLRQSIRVSLNNLLPRSPEAQKKAAPPSIVAQPQPLTVPVEIQVPQPESLELKPPLVMTKNPPSKSIKSALLKPLVKAEAKTVVSPAVRTEPAITPPDKTAQNVAPVPTKTVRTQPLTAPAVSPPSVAGISKTVAASKSAAIADAKQRGISSSYLALLRERIERYKKYPLLARKSRQQGIVVIEFELATSGELKSCLVRESCGHRLLDRAAVQAVKTAAPFPQIPPQLKLVTTSFVIPVRFVLGR